VGAVLTLILLASAPSAALQPAADTAASFFAFVTRSDEWIAIAGSEPLGWALFVSGLVIGFGWWFARHSVPSRARALRATSSEVAPLLAKTARSAIENAHRSGVLTRKELGDLQIFYEMWLNLAPEVRDSVADSLRAGGVDMIKLGEAIRVHRDGPLRDG
jgi:hypothetical protein